MPPRSVELPFPSPAPKPVPDLAPSDIPVVALTRIRPERHEWRFYRIEVWQDLFGGALLTRRWGRIGTEGRLRFDFHADHATALLALTRLAAAKRRRGYQDIRA